MIVIGILGLIVVAFLFAVLIMGVLGSVQRQARKMVQKGEVTNIKQAKRILSSLGSLPAQMRTEETDELHDKLGRLIEGAEMERHRPVGFRH